MGAKEIFQIAVAAAIIQEPGRSNLDVDQVLVEEQDSLDDEAPARMFKATVPTLLDVEAEGFVQRSRIGRGSSSEMSSTWTDGLFELRLGSIKHSIQFWLRGEQVLFEDPNLQTA